MKKILFVCTGNTCRSSMAEALMRHALEKRGIGARYQVESAGTSVYLSMHASHNAVMALEEMGIDLTGHVSRPVTAELLDGADLVLAMTAAHKRRLLGIKPDAAEKIFTLKEYCGEGSGSDVADPFGEDLGTYIGCRDDIRQCIEKIIDLLIAKGEL